jgi:hypothetical protein
MSKHDGGAYTPNWDPAPVSGTVTGTVGNVTIWPNTAPNTWPTTTTYSTWPTFCGGNLHVWGCDHQAVCRCGKVSRVVQPPTCEVCGQ